MRIFFLIINLFWSRCSEKKYAYLLKKTKRQGNSNAFRHAVSSNRNTLQWNSIKYCIYCDFYLWLVRSVFFNQSITVNRSFAYSIHMTILRSLWNSNLFRFKWISNESHSAMFDIRLHTLLAAGIGVAMDLLRRWSCAYISVSTWK